MFRNLPSCLNQITGALSREATNMTLMCFSLNDVKCDPEIATSNRTIEHTCMRSMILSVLLTAMVGRARVARKAAGLRTRKQ